MVTLLLTRGARASTEAAAEAVTFGYADVMRALVRAGVDVSFAESSGINLLHWAVITNRADVVPVLVAAGVPLDDVDGFNYTPLMYAVTLDQGDTETLDAVLLALLHAEVNFQSDLLQHGGLLLDERLPAE